MRLLTELAVILIIELKTRLSNCRSISLMVLRAQSDQWHTSRSAVRALEGKVGTSQFSDERYALISRQAVPKHHRTYDKRYQ